MTFSTDRAFRSLQRALVDVRLSGPESTPEFLRNAKFGSVQGQLQALYHLGVITWDQHCLLTDLLLNASENAGKPFPDERNVGPVMPSYVAYMRRQSPVKPSTQVPADDRPSEVSAPASCPELRLLCLLVQTRNGETRSLPVHTMRPMPPRVGPSGRWSLAGDPSFVLRETRAVRPAPEVLARYLRQRQTNAGRAHSRAV
jgi:hypothetical protein